MAPISFHLIVAHQPKDFISPLQSLSPAARPLYVGEVHHWMQAPHTLSTAALLGSRATMTDGLKHYVREKWSITSEMSHDLLADYATAQAKRHSNPGPKLPTRWSASNHSSLDASGPPPDLEASLALQSDPLGSNKHINSPLVLKAWIRTFGTLHSGAVQMFNLVSCKPGRRSDFYGYITAFTASVGSKYGGEGQILSFGHDVAEWSSRKEEGEMTVAEARKDSHGKGYGIRGGQEVGWEDVGLIWCPRIWHFAAMLDDPDYAEADRTYKQGVLRDGPILCCTEVDMVYGGA